MNAPVKPRPASLEPLRRRSIYLLPNLFTTLALFAGFYAVVQGMNHDFERAAIATRRRSRPGSACRRRPRPKVGRLKSVLRENRLQTVCEEASCPNVGECFGKGTATFMIMSDVCTLRCTFCDVGHGRPAPLDAEELLNLARTSRRWACATWS